jgi:hypothetical protein
MFPTTKIFVSFVTVASTRPPNFIISFVINLLFVKSKLLYKKKKNVVVLLLFFIYFFKYLNSFFYKQAKREMILNEALVKYIFLG